MFVSAFHPSRGRAAEAVVHAARLIGKTASWHLSGLIGIIAQFIHRGWSQG